MCDCKLGYISSDAVYKSNIEYEAKRVISVQQNLKKLKLLKGEPLTQISEVLDFRKGYLSGYTYCPFCGEKINWNKIKESLK
jgi:hypothetical protein